MTIAYPAGTGWPDGTGFPAGVSLPDGVSVTGLPAAAAATPPPPDLTLTSIALQPNEEARALVTVGDLRAQGVNEIIFSARTGQQTGSLEIPQDEDFLTPDCVVDRIMWGRALHRLILNRSGTVGFNATVLTGHQFLFFDHTSSSPVGRIAVGTTPTQVSTGFMNATFGAQAAETTFFDGLTQGDKFIIVWSTA